MEITLRTTVLFGAIILTGLTAGLCFTWSNAVTPGLNRLDDFSFLKAFQSMNRAIINARFLIVFFGPVLLLFLNTYLFRENETSFWLFLVAALLFFIGVSLITIFGNVPLNEILDKSNLNVLTDIELEEFHLRGRYQKW